MFFFLLGFLACDDGELQIETLDFDDIAIDDCNDITANGANILFKIDGDESLILQLQNGILNNGNSTTDTVITTSTIPGQSQLIYRFFSDNVSNAYFCDEIPPASPTVREEIEAESGVVMVKSIAINDSTAFSHTITLDDITLINEAGERITNLTVTEFGEVTTPISN